MGHSPGMPLTRALAGIEEVWRVRARRESVAGALLGTSPVLVSTVGLETYLGIAVLLGVAAAALRGQVALTGVLCGLAVLTRPDFAVPAAVLALLVARPPFRMAKLSAVAGLAALV